MPLALLLQVLAVLTVVGFVAGCRAWPSSPSGRPLLSSAASSSAQSPAQAQPVTLTVSAAASLQTVLTELEPAFEQRYPHIDVSYNWGGSGTLQRQIEQGAPVDIFFSASPRQMVALSQQGKLASSPSSAEDGSAGQILLTNQLVLIAPLDSPFNQFEDLKRLSAEQHIAVGEFRSVPAGQYAQAALQYFQLLPLLSDRMIFFNSVRGVLAAVESGNAEAGLVYRTDAQLSSRVKVVAIAPEQAHPPIHYPIAVLQRSVQPQAAQQFIDFLQGPAASETFEQYGFNTEFNTR